MYEIIFSTPQAAVYDSVKTVDSFTYSSIQRMQQQINIYTAVLYSENAALLKKKMELWTDYDSDKVRLGGILVIF